MNVIFANCGIIAMKVIRNTDVAMIIAAASANFVGTSLPKTLTVS